MKRFNRPKPIKKSIIKPLDVLDSEDEEMKSEDDQWEDIEDNKDKVKPIKSKSILYFTPYLTWKFHRKAMDHYDQFDAGLQPVEEKKRSREGIQKKTIEFIVDFVTSEEQLQGVAHGTLQMKDPDGKRVKIMRGIRRQHDAELIRQVQVLLKENDLQVPAASTLRKLFRLMPAGHAKEIKGLDPVYENHRRAFEGLQGICTELHDIFIAKDDYEKVDLVEKVQQGLATSATYLLGHFAYNLSLDSNCESHCVRFACSDSKNSKQ